LLADGRSLTVNQPYYVSVSGEDEIMSVDDDSGGVEIVDLALVIRYDMERHRLQKYELLR
jgi:hypothetical protein